MTIDTAAPPTSTADVYLRLHLLSTRTMQPRTINLDGIFALLPNNAWTNLGPIQPDHLDALRAARMGRGKRLQVFGARQVPADDRLRHTDAVSASPTRTASASALTSHQGRP